ncbi:MAG: YhcH/YjgK/YiaL family protein [Acidaminococcales bacterium]|jgi:YhcH/YjgK/YiaL family protein|nr:YhcH/YjgK/YiaL family protein [Acidaminococcales bacterium]
MIVEHRCKIDELLPYLPLRLSRALAYLRDADLDALPDGRHEIEGKDIYLYILSYSTAHKEAQTAEAHYKYIDIQYIIKGSETVYHAPIDPGLQSVKEKNLKEDYVFFDKVQNEKEYLQTTGSIMIFFPWDIHRTKCHAGGRPGKVRKAVIKVRAEG